MPKLIEGKNDLKTLFPEIAKEADGWDPTTLTPGSNKKNFWKCKLNHLYEASPYSRTGKDKTGCPICANKKVLAGFNDLKTRYPEIAKEADGWDPQEVMPGKTKKLPWKCNKKHTWKVSPNSRTNSNNGCPYCGNKKVWIGFNDLKTRYPEIAKEADGWDPSKELFGSKKKMLWNCEKNHIYKSAINARTGKDKTGCPICANKKVLAGFNDLETRYPDIAKEADGWDPSKELFGSHKKMQWKCNLKHDYIARISERIRRKDNKGCPYCAGKKAWFGFNDLETRYPDIAKEADGWNPQEITFGSHKKMQWKCNLDHKWKATVGNRTNNKTTCPYCSNKKILSGFNDLETRYPEIAKEADGWDPKEIMPGNTKKVLWKCIKGHSWKVSPNSRTGNKSGCPTCADSGFDPLKPAWFYLMKRKDEQQIGITNYLEQRIKFHKASGWKKIESVGPFTGKQVLNTETQIKRWLKLEIGLIKGTTENWSMKNLKVQSLSALKNKSKINTDIF